MAFGLKIWDASGNVLVDTGAYVLKELKIVSAAGNTSGSFGVTLPDPAVSVVPQAFLPSNQSGETELPQVNYSAGTVSYSPASSASSRTIEIRALIL